MELDTLPKLLKHQYETRPEVPAIRDKDFGIWNEYTWRDTYENVKYFSLGLMSLGLQPGDRAAIVGDPEPQLFWAQWAIQAARGTAMVMFTDVLGTEVQYFVTHSDSRFIIARDQEQVDKIISIWENLPDVEKVIYWYYKGMRAYEEPYLMRFDDVQELGRKHEETHPGLFEETVAQGKGKDIANFFYTSGTTGLPKGGKLTNIGLIKNTRKVMDVLGGNPLDENDDILCYLPPAWFAEPIYGSVPHLITAARLNIPEEPETLFQDMREIAPVMILGGPKQWEGWVSMIEGGIENAGGLERLVYRIFRPVAMRRAEAVVEKKEMSLWWRIIWSMGDFLIFHGIRDRLGMTRARLCNTGAFVLAPESFAFLTGLGIGLRQGYGATEGGVVTAHTLDDIRPDTCGAILPGVEVKITEDGEIIWKSELIFEGYHKNPEATEKAVRDGWYYSGDAGFINEDNHLVFLDRVSEMKKIRGGQSYAPQYIESRFRFSHYIKDAMTLGDENTDFVTAIINMEYETVGRWAEKRSIPYTTFTDLSQRPEVGELIGRQVDRVNQQLPPEMRIKKYVLLYKEFDADEAELTRSRKLKRGVVEEKYATLIDAMYSGSKMCSVESEFTYEDGRKGKISADVNIYEAETGGD